jgi:hypothetical protein
MTRCRTRRPLRIVRALGSIALTAACAGVVPAEEVSASLADQLQRAGIAAADITCPGHLTGVVGASITCSFTVDGHPVDAQVSVRSVDGDRALFAVTTHARPVAERRLEQQVGENVARRTGVAAPDVDCPDDLAPTEGVSVLCTIGDGGGSALVTVTRVSAGTVEYSVVVT